MTAAVRAVLPFVFDTLGLHRLEAACLPNNAASIKLLEKTGFKREGSRAAILGSMASGRTICFTRCSTRHAPLVRSREAAEQDGRVGELSALERRAAAAWRRLPGRSRWLRSLRAALVAPRCSCRRASPAPSRRSRSTPDQEKIDITAKGELYEGRGDTLQIETAPGPDGYIGRMAVQAATPGTNPGWFVFALTNPTDKPIERWLVAPRYTLGIRAWCGPTSTPAASTR